MRRRHPEPPTAWLITDERLGSDLLRLVARLPRGTGVLVRQHDLPRSERAALLRKLRRAAARRGLVLVDEAEGTVARVHSAREIARARLRGAEFLFLSPLFATRSHADWKALPRMKAAALARLAAPGVLALGGMDPQRFRRVAPLGFAGWAGIDGWLCSKRPPRE